ncbi:MAG: von Willebrand factor type A domain-containing protein [Bacteroidales bacterium]|jgi:Ca-activated chloride channel family protein|nr:von Willebrand factor type A domain-containing protein [Bacteroidales bacterium]MCI2121639.1 von Willebrand factor type A domain-containing protein [Bacteroidales bacterium]MCI2146283.1 von Willebrand factor type A domain-containing protein [Bacteroidales bacterium]
MKKNAILSLGIAMLSAAMLYGCSFERGSGINDINGNGKYHQEDNGEYEHYAKYSENPFISASSNPSSTFSIDADGASYANMRRFISKGMTPLKEAVRIEEFLNYFTFDYPEPQDGENISLNAEISKCPWA